MSGYALPRIDAGTRRTMRPRPVTERLGECGTIRLTAAGPQPAPYGRTDASSRVGTGPAIGRNADPTESQNLVAVRWNRLLRNHPTSSPNHSHSRVPPPHGGLAQYLGTPPRTR